jgi:hypothetical protein
MRRTLTLLILLVAPPAFSQGFEAALVAGYTTAGSLPHEAAGISKLEYAGSFTWGASAGYFFSPRFGIEGSWARQQSAVVIGTAQGSAEMFAVHVDQLQGSFVYQLGGGQARIRPFVAAGLGAAIFGAPELEGETKLSFGVAAGVKWLPTQRAGVRLQARYTPIHLNDSSSDFCDPFGFCQGWLHQLELTGGVVVRF